MEERSVEVDHSSLDRRLLEHVLRYGTRTGEVRIMSPFPAMTVVGARVSLDFT